jgi:hypothetical protein
MPKDTLSQIADDLEAKRAALDAEFVPKVRNHLIQLFRKAHKVDPKLTGVNVGMGTACATGKYIRDEDGESVLARDREYIGGMKARHVETEVWLNEVHRYSSEFLCNGRADQLPEINDITLKDL